MSIEQIESELMALPAAERLRLAGWLLDSLLNTLAEEPPSDSNPLLNIVGKFSGGPGDTAEKAEEILAKEVDSKYGLGCR